MTSSERGRWVFTLALIGAAVGVAAGWYFNSWALMWGGENPIPPGRYPRIVLLALYALLWILPLLASAAMGALAFGAAGFVVALLFSSTHK
jgi:hypothetical protein